MHVYLYCFNQKPQNFVKIIFIVKKAKIPQNINANKKNIQLALLIFI